MGKSTGFTLKLNNKKFDKTMHPLKASYSIDKKSSPDLHFIFWFP